MLLFNGLTAVGGGLALMTNWIPEQASWVRNTDFPSNYFPSVILMAVVGGSSLIAAALVKRSGGWQLASGRASRSSAPAAIAWTASMCFVRAAASRAATSASRPAVQGPMPLTATITDL